MILPAARARLSDLAALGWLQGDLAGPELAAQLEAIQGETEADLLSEAVEPGTSLDNGFGLTDGASPGGEPEPDAVSVLDDGFEPPQSDGWADSWLSEQANADTWAEAFAGYGDGAAASGGTIRGAQVAPPAQTAVDDGQPALRSAFLDMPATADAGGITFLAADGIELAQADASAGISAAAAAGRTFYVSTNGSDNGDGSAGNPFRTITRAIENLGAGDEVIVKAGTYNESLNINRGGSADGYVTITSETPGGALIRPPSGAWNAISVNANYVIVDGFDIEGRSGDGIEANHVHHVKILNNTIHGAGESGIQFNWSEFITIDGNETYDNGSSGWFSGISIYQNRNITGDTTTPGFRTIVSNNISHDNVTKAGQHTDGNGIIIDDFQSTQTGGYPSYTFPTLVENNLVYQNGGKGVQVTWSDYVTVRNNTAWHNNQDPLNTGTWRGELSNSQSSNNTWVNNIAVADRSINSNNTAIDNTSYGGYVNNVIWANNLTFNGTAGQSSVRTDGGNAMPSAANGNILGVDPGFMGAPGDFRLGIGSASIDRGTANYGLSAYDLDGFQRAVGNVDLGAFEKNSVSVVPPLLGTAGDDNLVGGSGNDTISGLAGNDTLEGRTGDDTLLGGDGDDRLQGDAGNDLLSGGNGTDTAVFVGPTATTVNLAVTTGQVTGHGTDTLTGIENIVTGSGNDVLTGDAQNNHLSSFGGDDRLSGAAGDDTLLGGSGNDSLYGGDGNDRLVGDVGNDLLDGGAGIDIAVFTGTAAATVNLSLTTAQVTGHGTDTLINVENVRSGSGNDRLTGSSLANKLVSANGNDVLNGAGGDDTLLAGDGNDVLNGGSGNDRLWGGAGADSFQFWAGGGADVVKDFEDNVDTVWFDAALWGGGAGTPASIIASHGAIVGGNAVFTFGAHVLTIEGVTNLNVLLDDISIL
ncbi:right-handed parallel beta-helix repeat-containing protein [Paracoccaceae bacterium Fryx2]|nr:right-handed parallel beta-helix repeat-containing protein [Paracoccaceae bacterium Fryx2]